MAGYRALHKLQICFTENQYNALKELSKLKSETMAAIVRQMVNKQVYSAIILTHHEQQILDENMKKYGAEKI